MADNRATGRLEDILGRIRRLEAELTDLRRQATESRISSAGDFQVLLCRVGPDLVGLVQSQLREVVPIPKLAPLPEAPPWVLGMLNLRGEILPVIDIRARLCGERRTPEISDHVVIADIDGRPAGFVVGEVSSAVEATGRDIEAVPADAPFAPYMIGVLLVDNAPVPLLDPASLLRIAMPGGGEP
jgi:purine-binding chemotaxis protein CheW